MKEQIYINGTLMEMQEGKTSSLVFQSPYFTDIDSIVSNRTNSVDFPVTPKNLKAINNSQLSGYKSSFPYSKHKVIYCLDGIQIFSGYGVLLSVTQTAIKFSFVWGNVNSFKAMLDVKLRELPEEYVTWDYDQLMSNNQHYDPTIDWGVGNHTIAGGSKLAMVGHPYQRVSVLLDKIEEASGVTIEDKERFSKYAIPCVSKNADDMAKRTNAVHVTSRTALSKLKLTDNAYYLFVRPLDSEDHAGWRMGNNGFLNVAGIDTIGLHIPAGGLYYSISSDTGSVNGANVCIYGASDEDGADGYSLWQGGSFDPSLRPNRVYKLVKDIDVQIDVRKFDFIAIRLAWGSSSMAVTWLGNPNVYVYDVNNDQVMYGGLFPLQLNMPDWTASQLLKNLMKMEGVFAHCTNENTIRFVSVDDMFRQRENAPDWTSKIKLKNGIPTEKTSKFMDLAQNNICKYADDDTNSKSYSSAMQVLDTTLEKEKSFMSLDFAGTDSISEAEDNFYRLRINAYKKTVEEGSVSLEFSEVKPRILEIFHKEETNENRLRFSTIDMPVLIDTSYFTYRQLIERPKVIKASVRLSSVELSFLDLTVPVYSTELGHYYCVTKLTAKSDGTAEAELLQLASGVATPDDIPDQIKDLSIVYDEVANVAYAYVPSLSQAQNEALRTSPSHKIFILRDGYTRRGEFFKYRWQGKPEKDVSTHTDRKNFRRFRGGWKRRIMGQEYMYNAGVMTGQTAQKYSGSTLVFSLGDRIILPENSSKNKHRKIEGAPAGTEFRIQNPGRNGLAELYIAMYRYEGGRWKKISNTVQVRGRSEDKTEQWEFIDSNVTFSLHGK